VLVIFQKRCGQEFIQQTYHPSGFCQFVGFDLKTKIAMGLSGCFVPQQFRVMFRNKRKVGED